MPPTIDPEYASSAQPRSGSPREPSRPNLTDLHDRPRKRMHPILVAGMASLLVGAAFYGAEAYLPPEHKPSFFIGGYHEAINEASKSGELRAQSRYDEQLRNMDIQHQDVIKRIETGAIQWQEHCRTGLQAFSQHYQAVYQRAGILAQGMVQIQQGYQQMRNQIMANTFGGETGLINLLNTIAPLVALIDPNAARQLAAIAREGRQQLLATFDREARNVRAIDVRGWDTGLPRPDTLPVPIRCDVPAFVTGVQANPVRLPPPSQPRR